MGIKLEEGKEYRTRDGRKVTGITPKRHKYCTYDFYGHVEGEVSHKARVFRGNGNHGSHYVEREKNLDIVAEWHEPETIATDNNDYHELRQILDRAYQQAASGKGKERHANGKPFNRQPIAEIGRMVGTPYNLGQAMRKAQEAQGMINRGETEKAAHELLGAINYIASAIMLIEEGK